MPTQFFNPLLSTPKDEELERARQYAQMTQSQRAAMDARVMEQQSIQGAENVARGALGLPESEATNRSSAANEIRALTKKTTPGTPEFYTAAAAIYQKYGLAAEAEKMTQMLHEVEFGKGETLDLLKLQRVRDYLQKRLAAGDESVKPALEAVDRKLGTYGQMGSPPADPEFIKMLNEYEKAVAAGQGDRADAIKQAMDAWIKNKQKAGGDMTPYQQAMLKLRGAQFDEQKRKQTEKEANEKKQVLGSLGTMLRITDEQIQAAEGLLTHPGLPYIVGRFVGLAGRVPAAFSDAAAGAQALYKTIEAQTFLSALNELRATSKSGATGLGQLTEREGDKIQSAKAALDRQQPTEQFKATLQRYIDSLKTGRDVNASELTAGGATVPPPLAPIQHRKPVAALAPSARPRPQPTPAPAPEASKPKRKFTATKVED